MSPILHFLHISHAFIHSHSLLFFLICPPPHITKAFDYFLFHLSFIYQSNSTLSLLLLILHYYRATSALSGSASLLSGSLSKIFRSFLTHPKTCLPECEKPKSLKLFLQDMTTSKNGEKDEKINPKQFVSEKSEKGEKGKSSDRDKDKDRESSSKQRKSKIQSFSAGDSTKSSGSSKSDRCDIAVLLVYSPSLFILSYPFFLKFIGRAVSYHH